MSQSGTFFNGTTPPPGTGIQTVTGNTGGAVGPDGAGNIDIVGAGPITVDGNAGSFTETINIANATTAAVGVVELATDAETIAGTDSVRAVVPSGLKAKLGVQTDHAVAIGNTDSLAIQWSNVGTNGQVLLGATAGDPAFATLTSTGGTISFTTGANALNLEAVGSGASVTVNADVGSATPVANILNLNGLAGRNISTAGAGNTLTVAVSGTTTNAVQIGNATGSLDDVAVGAANTVLLGTGAAPIFGQVPNAALVNSTITVTGDQNITVGGSPVALGGALTLSFPDIDQYELVTATAGGAAQSLPAGTGTSGQVLTSNGAAAYPTWQTPSSGSVIATQFTTSGTWTKNASTQLVEIFIIGAGGGGGSGSRGSLNADPDASMGGAGGCPSGAMYMQSPAMFWGASSSVTVGAGGIGGVGVAVNSTPGNTGGNAGISSVGTAFVLPNASATGGPGGSLTGTSSPIGAAGAVRYFSGAPTNSNIVTSSLRLNGPGGNGAAGRPSSIAIGNNSAIDVFYVLAAGFGGGGGGSLAGLTNTGGNGSNVRSAFDSSYTTSGGGGTVLVSAGAGGVVVGAAGGAGSSPSFTNGYPCGGSGGGGGAGVINPATQPGNGGAGGYPGGGGGGGAGGINGGAFASGSGGNGADSMIIIIEHLGTFTVV